MTMTLTPILTLALCLLPFNLPKTEATTMIKPIKQKVHVLHRGTEKEKPIMVKCAACGEPTSINRSVCEECERNLLEKDIPW